MLSKERHQTATGPDPILAAQLLRANPSVVLLQNVKDLFCFQIWVKLSDSLPTPIRHDAGRLFKPSWNLQLKLPYLTCADVHVRMKDGFPIGDSNDPLIFCYQNVSFFPLKKPVSAPFPS